MRAVVFFVLFGFMQGHAQSIDSALDYIEHFRFDSAMKTSVSPFTPIPSRSRSLRRSGRGPEQASHHLENENNNVLHQPLANVTIPAWWFALGSGVAVISLAFIWLRRSGEQKRSMPRRSFIVERLLKRRDDDHRVLAQELHDGVGGLLSGVKHSLGSLKSTIKKDQNNADVVDRAMDMIDHAIVETRRIANDLSPEALTTFGLVTAIQDRCALLKNSGLVKVDVIIIEAERRLSSTTEKTLYWVFRELIDNAVKHARATHVLVQLALQDKTFTMTIEDDGVGCNEHELVNGRGWSKIVDQVDYLQGKIDLQTAVGKGTSVVIEINTDL